MPELITETGKVFPTAEEALAHIRECARLMLDGSVSQVKSQLATTELLYTVKALDQYLSAGGELPFSWKSAFNPFVPPKVRVL